MSQENNSNKKNLVVLISNVGAGTNLRAIIEEVKYGKINAYISAVVSDDINSPGLKWAREAELPIKICDRKEKLLAVLNELNPDYVALAGWKQIIPDEVILAYPRKILNLHPGLIPDVKGGRVDNPDGTIALWNKGMLANKAIQNFLDLKSTYAGSTIHFLTLEFDFGPVLGRVFEKIEQGDAIESLYARLKKKENELYARVIEKLCQS